MTEEATNASIEILEILRDVSPDAQARVLRVVALLLGIELPPPVEVCPPDIVGLAKGLDLAFQAGTPVADRSWELQKLVAMVLR